VIGGGIAGIQASLDLAETGQKVYLLESSPAIGGTMPQLDKTFPTNDCSMCILSPKIVECGRHLNIETITWSDLEGITGTAGNYTALIRKRARYVDVEKCTGCGECAETCPIVIPSEFDASLSERKAIFRPYPQAYPSAFVIDKQLYPPCRNACPAGVNVHGFIALLAQRKFDEALELYRSRNPFPATCGRICNHPCQEACNRGKLDDPLAVRDLHRFLADMEMQAALDGKPPEQSEKVRQRREAEFIRRGEGRKVAIVGSGPAGLTCAWDLANMQYKPVVFEKLSVAGGMLRVGIPRYRLPVEVLDYEIDAIKRAGVEIKLETPVGPDLTLNDLFNQGFEAIFIAIGTHKSRRLGIEGEDLDGVIHGTGFLERSKMGRPAEIADKVVVVIGGGNAAIDAARTSLRLGARRVTILYRRSRVEMPARADEIEACENEGIEFRFQVSPRRILGEEGNVAALECVRTLLGPMDESGRRKPVTVEGSRFIIEADVVIPVIGREAEVDVLSGLKAVQVTDTGLIPVSGTDLSGVRGFTDLLRAASLGEPIDLGERTIVIGGGNVAVDVARTVVRLGCREVHLACLESPEEMFASPEEVQAAQEEGVIIHNRLSPKRIVGDDGHVTGIEFRQCLSLFDSDGKFSPIVKQGTETIMPAETVVIAIGQAVDWDMLRAADGVLMTRAGFLSVNENTMATNVKRIFAGGDVVTGPDVAVEAIVAGHKAATSIDRFLNSEEMLKGRDDIRPPLPADRIAPVPEGPHLREPVVPMPVLPIEERVRGFDEVELGYTEEQAVKEAERCLHCTICSECLQCVQVCKADAIIHDQQDELVEINIGAVVVAAGFEEFLASQNYDFGYSRYPDVVTSIEFERILSASGPYTGHVQRLSDGAEPKKIAFLQCVGSRDISCRNRYCSSVCCMYAIKEGVIAKEHLKGVDVTVFFMDMRAFGKDFDKYYERAKSEYGVKFVRARVSDVDRAEGNGRLSVRYADDTGAVAGDEFDMVVLSVGLEPSEKIGRVAEKLGIRLEPNGFIWTTPLNPLETSRPGIFVGGAASGPKDIPETVTQASGMAGKASQLLAEKRNTLTVAPEYPPERDVSGQEPRIGVFVCQCGINIGGIVEVPSAVEYARSLPDVVYAEDNLYTCSQDTQNHIREMIEEHGLNRVIVASCSPRTHEPLFRETLKNAGINPYLFEMTNIRDQCSWVHRKEPEKATKKAKDLIRMAVAKARLLKPLTAKSMPVHSGVLVIGGGLAGMTAALSLAEQGFEVSLVERQTELGGNLRHIHYLLNGDDPQKLLNDTIRKVDGHENITVWSGAEVESIEGFVGNFKSVVAGNGTRKEIEHGVVIVATGAAQYDPSEYLYRSDGNVLTQRELEERLAAGAFKAENVVMIQCVGSREEGHMYCSRVCCATAVKNALKIKDVSPDTDVFILYRDIRTYGFHEEYYLEARERGIVFIRYDENEKPEVANGNGLQVLVGEPLLKKKLLLHPDMIVLSGRIDANPDNESLAQMLKIPVNEDGFFLEAHMKLRPVDFATEGVFLAGMAHAPKNIEETIAQAEAAAGRAATIVSKKELELEATISEVVDANCDGCAYCIDPCPYNALTLIEYRYKGAIKKTVERNEALCKGCGVCMATCPKQGIFVRNFTIEQLQAMVAAALEQE